MSSQFEDLKVFQAKHRLWLGKNFPNQTPHQALLGVSEEVGELAHAHLKYEQGIRGLTRDEYLRQAGDAIGDIIIYLASYCNTNGLSLAGCLAQAWREVSERDWIHNPDTGVAPDAGLSERAEADEQHREVPDTGGN